MIFGSGLFYCFTSWSDFGKNYQFIAITGGGAFIFLFEVVPIIIVVITLKEFHTLSRARRNGFIITN